MAPAGDTAAAGAIRLSEILPAPKTRYAGEWIELANVSASLADLSGWALDDGEGGGKPFQLPAGTTIASGGLLVVQLPKDILNNAGDTVRLLTPAGNLADSYSYEHAAPDTSFCLTSQSWQSCEPSPGQPNSAAPASTDPAASQPAPAEPSAGAPDLIVASQSMPGDGDVAPQPLADRAPAWPADSATRLQPYALPIGGTLYRGLLLQPPTSQPTSVARRRPASQDPAPPAAPPAQPLGGGVGAALIALGGAAAGYDRLRARQNPATDAPASGEPGDTAQLPENSEPADDCEPASDPVN
jgi:hypothetical protein